MVLLCDNEGWVEAPKRRFHPPKLHGGDTLSAQFFCAYCYLLLPAGRSQGAGNEAYARAGVAEVAVFQQKKILNSFGSTSGS